MKTSFVIPTFRNINRGKQVFGPHFFFVILLLVVSMLLFLCLIQLFVVPCCFPTLLQLPLVVLCACRFTTLLCFVVTPYFMFCYVVLLSQLIALPYCHTLLLCLALSFCCITLLLGLVVSLCYIVLFLSFVVSPCCTILLLHLIIMPCCHTLLFHLEIFFWSLLLHLICCPTPWFCLINTSYAKVFVQVLK